MRYIDTSNGLKSVSTICSVPSELYCWERIDIFNGLKSVATDISFLRNFFTMGLSNHGFKSADDFLCNKFYDTPQFNSKKIIPIST